MDQEYICLMQILLGNPNPSVSNSLHNLNPDYAAAINNHVNALNTGLKLKGKNQFVGIQPCPRNLSSSVIGPVPFASYPFYNGDQLDHNCQYKIAVFGLNPYLGDNVCEEKNQAGNNLGDYAGWYTSKNYKKATYTSASIPFVLNNPVAKTKMSPYYANIFKILYPLINNCGFTAWSTIFKGCYTPELKADRYLATLTNAPLIYAELIPFHSEKTDTIDVLNLYSCNPNYSEYHEEMFKMLDRRLSNDGILFSNGNSASAALKQTMGTSLNITKKIAGCEFGFWKGRYTILLSEQLRRKGGIFNSNPQIARLVNDINLERARLIKQRIIN